MKKIGKTLRGLKVVSGRVMQVGAVVVAGTSVAMAQSSVDGIVTAASTTFGAVATLCVTIGTFMIGYKLARKVR